MLSRFVPLSSPGVVVGRSSIRVILIGLTRKRTHLRTHTQLQSHLQTSKCLISDGAFALALRCGISSLQLSATPNRIELNS